MKFPKELSPERLSLLSQEDRAIYEQEHAQKTHSSNIIQESGIEEIFINNPIEFEDEIDYDTAKEIYDSVCEDVMSEVSNRKNDETFQFYFTEDIYRKICKTNVILEGAEGLDPYAWIKGLGLGKLGAIAAAGLAGLGTGIAYLLTHGKDRIAMARLKRYFNVLVETVD